MKNKIFTTSLFLIAFIQLGFCQWTTVGTAGFGGVNSSTNQRMTIDQSTGTVYVASDDYKSSGPIRYLNVRKYENGEWTMVGSSIVANYGTNKVHIFDLVVNPTTHQPYVVFAPYTQNDPGIYAFDGTNWNAIGDASQFHRGPTANDHFGTRLVFNSGVPTLIFRDGYNSNYANLCLYLYTGGNWVRQTAAELPNCKAMDFDINPSNNRLTVAFEEWDKTNSVIKGLKIMEWYNSSWHKVGTYTYANTNNNTGAICNNPQLEFANNGTTYIAFRDDAIGGTKVTVRKKSGSNWVLVGSAGFTGDIIGRHSLSIDAAANEPLLAYTISDGTNRRLNVRRYSGSQWVDEGTDIDPGNAYPDIVIKWNSQNDRMYTLFRDMINSKKNTVLTKCTSYSVSGSTSDNNCNGGSDGSINLTLTGNTSGQTYFNWDNGSHTEDISGLAAGTYNCSIDDLGCIESVSYTISEPSEIITNGTIDHISCNGASTGNITQSISGGESPYSYSWDNGSTTKNISNTTAGIYSCTITDNKGCEVVSEYEITEPDAISITETLTNPTCWGYANGSISMDIIGGTSPYNFEWNNGSSSQNISSLIDGEYSCSVSDDNGCTESVSYTLIEPEVISATAQISNVISGGDGAIDLSPSGGTGVLSFLWSNTEITEDISSLDPGEYSVIVSDENSCSQTFNYSVSFATANFNNSANNALAVSPNPAKDFIYIKGIDDTNALITIYSATGNQLMTIKNYTGEKPININKLSEGIYLIHIKSNGIIRALKLIKK